LAGRGRGKAWWVRGREGLRTWMLHVQMLHLQMLHVRPSLCRVDGVWVGRTEQHVGAVKGCVGAARGRRPEGMRERLPGTTLPVSTPGHMRREAGTCVGIG
jgi:hypothetical protein